MSTPDPELTRGPISAELEAEFPGLSLITLDVEGGSGRSPRAVKERLRILSDRFTGAQAVSLRHQPIPWAYRVFYRHIGLDPDVQRTPIEELALQRLKDGGFRSRNLLDDALTIAIVESGVALRTFDADRVSAPLGVRPSIADDELEGRPGSLPEGTLVIADAQRPVSLLFGAVASGRGVSSKSTRISLAAIGVNGVPGIAVEEALWLAAGILRG